MVDPPNELKPCTPDNPGVQGTHQNNQEDSPAQTPSVFLVYI